MTRDILDKDGNVIGSLSLPDDTSEDVWTLRLSEYLPKAPTVLSPQDIARAAVKFGREMIIQISTESEMAILTTDQMNELIGLAGGIQLMLMTGALGTAMNALANTDFQGLFTVDVIQKYVTLLANYTGVTAPTVVDQSNGGS